jgi:ribonucleoside-diphosphate reductase alpha chain
MNLFIRDANVAKINKALFYGWSKGLKTGMYYLRSNAKSEARKSLGTDVNSLKEKELSTNGLESNTIDVIENVSKINPTEKIDSDGRFVESSDVVDVVISSSTTDMSKEESSAMSQMVCSLDNPDDCEACGS